jgi:hypothetical protein
MTLTFTLRGVAPSATWKVRHNAAITDPYPGPERAIVDLAKAIDAYTALGVLPDGVLSQYAAQLLQGFVGLLNGPTGDRLDCARLDSWARDAAERIGWDLDRDVWVGR